jgi:H+/Cl- antiporter ClcA/CBS domain-containing protein
MEDDRTKLNAAEGLPVAPSLEDTMSTVQGPPPYQPIDRRVIGISALAMLVGAAGALIASGLTLLIALITNISYYGHVSFEIVRPAVEHLGYWSILVPVVGALIGSIMARYGAAAIRGHGIPEVMERILFNKSEVSPKIMFLKPTATAIVIGTGGPFGAEGPIIATGGALGSFIGQIIHVTADERKTLLAAGAAAGMAATFNSPVAAVLLAVELLLFEYRPRSLIPVALASAVATTTRAYLPSGAADFSVPPPLALTFAALMIYVALGAVIGLISVGVTRFVYWLEDVYDELPIHWMWWPVLGAVVVGVIGMIDPRTLGVGYQNINQILGGHLVGTALLMLVVLKFLSWAVYLGSGTSGGTLAPLFTIGGGAGALLGAIAIAVAPHAGVDIHVAALIGMAAIFAGASHALLASVVFAFEITKQPIALLPLLAGCSTAYMISLLLMRGSIMTEKLLRRGTAVRTEYTADFLDRVLVRDAATRDVATIPADKTLSDVRSWLTTRSAESTHQGFPVVTADGTLLGVVTRRDLLDHQHDPAMRIRDLLHRAAAVVYEHNTLREAADHMVREGVGRLPVVNRDAPRTVVGILSRSDLLTAHRDRLAAAVLADEPPRARGWMRRQARKSGAYNAIKSDGKKK